MVQRCACPGCPNRNRRSELSMSKTERLTFHLFPINDPERVKLWLLAVRRKVNYPIRYVKVMKLCSKHFLPDDFAGRACEGKLRRLKKTAVPSQLLHNKQETLNASAQLSQESEGSTQDPQSADPLKPNQDPPSDSPLTSQPTQATDTHKNTDLSFAPEYLADDCSTNKVQFNAGSADRLKLKDESVAAIRDPHHEPPAIEERSFLRPFGTSPGGETRTPEGTRAKTTIDIGRAFPLWRKVREQMGFESDSEMAFFLLQRVCDGLVSRPRKSAPVPALPTEGLFQKSESDLTHPSDKDEDMEASEIIYEVPPACQTDESSQNGLKSDDHVKSEHQLMSEDQIKSESQLMCEDQIKTEHQLMSEDQIKTEHQLMSKDQIKTEHQLMCEDQIKTEHQLMSKDQIKTEHQLMCEDQIKTEHQLMCVDQIKTEDHLDKDICTVSVASTENADIVPQSSTSSTTTKRVIKEEPVETELQNTLEVNPGPCHTKIDHNYVRTLNPATVENGVMHKERPPVPKKLYMFFFSGKQKIF